MKKLLHYIFLFSVLFPAFLNGQILRPFSARYTNSSIRGNIVFVANNFITTTGASTTEVAPAGSSTNNGGAAAYLDIDNPAPVTIMNYGGAWKYLDNNTRPLNWETVAFVDATWPSANAQFGWGQASPAPNATCLNSGCASSCPSPPGSCSSRTPAYYFRRVVNIPNPLLYTAIRLNLGRNDGVVIYINGTERARDNMPAGAIAHGTFSTSAIAPGAAESYTVDLSPSFFAAGNNTIAVEIHSDKAKAADVSFNMQIQGIDDNGTFNSSSADLSLNTCSDVLWAGLYWGASQGTNGTNTTWITGETGVKLKVPGAASYVNVTSTQSDYHNGTLSPGLPHTGYRCFADITSLINTSSPNGTYTLANLVGPAGINNGSGGWSIVIAYHNASLAPRNLVVYDGSVIMNGGDPSLNVPISGFLTPPSGPVSCQLGAVVYDGDRVSTDSFAFKQNSNPAIGTYTNLTPNATSNLNDMWNSTISHLGSIVTTRNPAHQNTLGFDADIIDVPNAGNAVLGNSQTSASVKFGSPSENYFVHVLTTSISQFNPSFTLIKSSTDVNGGALAPGDVSRYQLDYTNVGTDTSLNSIIVDNIPVGTSYKAGSLVINGVSKTDGSGDDQAEFDIVNNRVVFRIGNGASAASGGSVLLSGNGTVRFEVYVPASCQVLSCNPTLTNTARVDYTGKTSGIALYDSSGYNSGGCFIIPGAITNTVTGSCVNTGDTSIINTCPSLTVTIPAALYGGYQFYTAQPFVAANLYNISTAVTTTRTLYAYFDGAGSCDDTVRLNIFINPCPDIDDDDDGIPDTVEGGGVDPSADADSDGTPNFVDPTYPGFVDANGDGVNDNFDYDRDGIPNHLDLDSDNDGIPDVVESGGVDANGDGRIDNYSDTDNDGFSQNVDANNTGVSGSGNGLGAVDLDGDGIANYLDLDSDNDGVPDVVEAFGTDANNDGKIDGYTDTDADGFSDSVDGDVGNDGTAENSANTLLRTGADINADGRADSYPYKNMDNDSRANPYDLDSDGDGISDVREAGFTDANSNGQSDGVKGADGWDDTIDAMASINLRNTDGSGNPNIWDVDSDNDGIPDNVEGPSTSGYQLPAAADTDGDGIDNKYDNTVGFGGNGITPNDQDADGQPDYYDLDTDNDGLADVIEGNDFNLNNIRDDNVTLTGIDTDGDGLDDRFDLNNSNVEGTSLYMGNGGTFTGDPTPGSRTMVQATLAGQERDWRYNSFTLPADIFGLTGNRNGPAVKLNWLVTCDKIIDHFDIERSTDGINFNSVAQVAGTGGSCNALPFHYDDEVASVAGNLLYYRVMAVAVNGQVKRSNFITLRLKQPSSVTISPNPATNRVNIGIVADGNTKADVYIYDNTGRIMLKQSQALSSGYNSFLIQNLGHLTTGVYSVYIRLNTEMSIHKLIIKR